MLHLSIATPEEITYDDEVHSLTIPGTLGYMQILTDHAPLISSLGPGTVTVITRDQQKLTYTITGGFFEVSHNRATLLADAIQ